MNLMFVCTGNTGRSVMAQAIFNSMVKSNPNPRIQALHAVSAGVSAIIGEGPEEFTEVVLTKRGILLCGHQAELVTAEMLEEMDLVLTMEDKHKKRILDMQDKTTINLEELVYTITEYVGDSGNIDDCYGHELGFYEQCANRLVTLIEKVIEKLEKELVD